MSEAKAINWDQLLLQLQAKNGNASNSDTFIIPKFAATLSKGGKQIKYGRRLLVYNPEVKDWKSFERDGPSRWDPANRVEEDKKVLDEYRTALEEYTRS